MTYFDPRITSLGARMVCPKDSLEIDENDINKKDTTEDFEIIRLLNCVPEGSKELKEKLPLNYNLHKLNGISFQKGCYIGQELTQRTFHTGVIRKVLMPFIIADKLIFTSGESGK
jgi:folate-binding protein YgfZ